MWLPSGNSFTVPAHALYFWGYETAKRTLQYRLLAYAYVTSLVVPLTANSPIITAHRPSVPLEEKGALVHFVSGMFADLMGSFIWVPQVQIARLLASHHVERQRTLSHLSYLTST
jgi:hypothetical protein